MATLTPQESLFYRDLYKVINDTVINDLLVKFATIEYNKALAKVRTKGDEYDHGRANGLCDAWQAVINIKETITKIMNNGI